MFGEIKAAAIAYKWLIILALSTALLIAGYSWHRSVVNTEVGIAVQKIQLELTTKELELKNLKDNKQRQINTKVAEINANKDAELRKARSDADNLRAFIAGLPNNGSNQSNSKQSGTASVAEGRPEDILGVLRRSHAVALARYSEDAETVRVGLLSCYKQYDELRNATLEYIKQSNK